MSVCWSLLFVCACVADGCWVFADLLCVSACVAGLFVARVHATQFLGGCDTILCARERGPLCENRPPRDDPMRKSGQVDNICTGICL